VIFGVDEVEHRPRLELCGRVPEEMREGRVDSHEVPVRSDDRYRIGRQREDAVDFALGMQAPLTERHE
jgi:hypothetical protein